MFGFWLPIGLLIASIGLFATAIAKKLNRVTAETYRMTAVIWSVAAVMLILGFGWSSYQTEQALRRFEHVKTHADLLQKSIKAVEARQQLLYFADPLQEEDAVALQNYRKVQASSIRDETKAITQELASAGSQFDAFTQARMQREFILFLCVVVPAAMLTVGAIYRDDVRRRHDQDGVLS